MFPEPAILLFFGLITQPRHGRFLFLFSDVVKYNPLTSPVTEAKVQSEVKLWLRGAPIDRAATPLELCPVTLSRLTYEWPSGSCACSFKRRLSQICPWSVTLGYCTTTMVGVLLTAVHSLEPLMQATVGHALVQVRVATGHHRSQSRSLSMSTFSRRSASHHSHCS